MPIYCYECEDCKEKIEILCKIKEKDEQVCPKCGKKLKRNISKFGFKINGKCYKNGWN